MKNSSSLNFFKNVKSVGFFGIGKSNEYIMQNLPRDISVILRSDGKIDRATIPRGIKISAIYEKARAFDNLGEDILFLSPSVRRERAELDSARANGVRLSSDLELFLSESRMHILAVSGSDGKSTTASLTHEMLKNVNKSVLIGNIGRPFSAAIGEDAELAVCELSSFHLRYTKIPARRSAVTNITPNHLNWHKDFREYKETKLSLLDGAKERIISADDAYLAEYGREKELFAVASVTKGYRELCKTFRAEFYLTAEEGFICRNGKAILPIRAVLRKEEHNIKNLLTAIALAEGYTTDEQISRVAGSFTGLSHRIECICTARGVRYIDSSIDTSPSRTAATLASLGENIIIILGGKDKGIEYDSLCEPLRAHAKLAVITGENREKIYDAIKEAVSSAMIADFREAVIYALSSAKPSDTVLLSPASASYDSFTSFEERGEYFKEIIGEFCKNNQNL